MRVHIGLPLGCNFCWRGQWLVISELSDENVSFTVIKHGNIHQSDTIAPSAVFIWISLGVGVSHFYVVLTPNKYSPGLPSLTMGAISVNPSVPAYVVIINNIEYPQSARVGLAERRLRPRQAIRRMCTVAWLELG